MPLLLDGQPFDPFTNEKVFGKKLPIKEDFETEHIWRVAKHLISRYNLDGDGPGVIRLRAPANTGIPVEYLMVDNAGKRIGKVRYFESADYDDAKKKYDYAPYSIDIDRTGVLKTTQRDADLNWFLTNHPRNASNPLRSKIREGYGLVEAKFESVSNGAEIDIANRKMRAVQFMMPLLSPDSKDAWKWNQLVGACESLTEGNDFQRLPAAIKNYRSCAENKTNEDLLRSALFNYMMEFPYEVKEHLHYSKTRKITTAISQLQKAELLRFDGPGRKWVMKDEKDKDQVLCVAPDKDDPLTYLIAQAQLKDGKIEEMLMAASREVPV